MSSKAASGENRARIRKEIDLSSGTKSLCLSHCGLAAIPKDVFARSDEFLTSLRLLDLSFNNIITISPDVSLMRSLRELWLSNNPNLTILPDSISQLLKLEVLDIRSTMVKSVPPSFCQLNFLFQFTWDSTPLESELITNYKIAVNDVTKLKDQLYQIYTRSGLETKLLDDLTSEHFAKESDRPHINDFITDLVRQLSVMFPDLKDFQYFVKRAMTMLPEKSSDINEISLQITKDKFYNMRKDTHRKRLAADVEIKLRGFYFDRIERKEVTECIDSMYHHILLLEDIQFFIKYATSVLPAQPEDATGEKIWRNILELQKGRRIHHIHHSSMSSY